MKISEIVIVIEGGTVINVATAGSGIIVGKGTWLMPPMRM